MDPVVDIWWNFLWSIPGVLLAPWHHFQHCQEAPCPPRLKKRDLKVKETLDMVQDAWPGVFENMEVPEKAGYSVRGLEEPLVSLKKISKFGQQGH